MKRAYKGANGVHYGFADELLELTKQLFAPVGELTEIHCDGYTISARLELHPDVASHSLPEHECSRVKIEHTSILGMRRVTLDLVSVFQYTYRENSDAIEHLMPAVKEQVTWQITQWIRLKKSA